MAFNLNILKYRNIISFRHRSDLEQINQDRWMFSFNLISLTGKSSLNLILKVVYVWAIVLFKPTLLFFGDSVEAKLKTIIKSVRRFQNNQKVIWTININSKTESSFVSSWFVNCNYDWSYWDFYLCSWYIVSLPKRVVHSNRTYAINRIFALVLTDTVDVAHFESKLCGPVTRLRNNEKWSFVLFNW